MALSRHLPGGVDPPGWVGMTRVIDRLNRSNGMAQLVSLDLERQWRRQHVGIPYDLDRVHRPLRHNVDDRAPLAPEQRTSGRARIGALIPDHAPVLGHDKCDQWLARANVTELNFACPRLRD